MVLAFAGLSTITKFLLMLITLAYMQGRMIRKSHQECKYSVENITKNLDVVRVTGVNHIVCDEYHILI